MFKAFAAAGLEFVSIGLLALTGVHPELLDLPVSLAILLRCHRLCALGGNDFRPSGIGSSGVPGTRGRVRVHVHGSQQALLLICRLMLRMS